MNRKPKLDWFSKIVDKDKQLLAVLLKFIKNIKTTHTNFHHVFQS